MQRKKNRSAHVFTSRDKGSGRTITEIAMFILLAFGLCSIYAIILTPDNPAAWSMLVFFIFGFLLLAGYEENIFPDITKRKIPHAVITWFFAWMLCAFLVSALVTMNLSHATIAIMMAVVVLVGTTFVVSTEKGWTTIKTNVKKNTGGKIKEKIRNTKTGAKIGKRLKRRKKSKEKRNRRIQSW